MRAGLTETRESDSMAEEDEMGRDWFKHDINARHDLKIVAMRNKYGITGYGAWWMLVEILRDTEGYKLPVREIPLLKHSLDFPEAETFVADCINEYFLLESDGEYIWSKSLMKRMEAYEALVAQRTAAGRLGGVAKAKQTVASAKQSLAKSGDLIRLDKIRVDKKNIREEFAPQVDEVFEYFRTKTGSQVLPTTKPLRSLIHARLAEGYTVDQCKRAIAFVYADKKDNPEQKQYIRIQTIFAPTKFAGYLDAQLRYSEGEK